jgi:hypothetical protein
MLAKVAFNNCPKKGKSFELKSRLSYMIWRVNKAMLNVSLDSLPYIRWPWQSDIDGDRTQKSASFPVFLPFNAGCDSVVDDILPFKYMLWSWIRYLGHNKATWKKVLHVRHTDRSV